MSEPEPEQETPGLLGAYLTVTASMEVTKAADLEQEEEADGERPGSHDAG